MSVIFVQDKNKSMESFLTKLEMFLSLRSLHDNSCLLLEPTKISEVIFFADHLFHGKLALFKIIMVVLN